ncbi:DUF2628 domain-containing protein [Ferrovibrio sp.]|uniref:DUF2628 domain-containing protein n=1 Tax=Ferrovibrio sp. TaxID=1917215 RepID=UPI000CA91ED1|nr:DUF2628 domain-containing protein [Ferrovibrio sp.]PJI43430.1 MAG: hypothetical protein CTR53_03960 [Ferrovibrio sp.]
MTETTTTGATVAEAAPAAETDRSMERLLRLFFGRNAERFLLFYYEDRDWTNNRHGARRSVGYFDRMNFAAMFFPIAWFFYRRMYLYGAVLLVTPIVIALLFPSFSMSGNTGIAIAISVMANPVYFYYARQRVTRIEKRIDLSPQSRDDLIRRAGGVSIFGAILGGALTAAVFIIIIAGATKG